jgi:glycosyltransferase involved in cell wall biosynthesis
VGKPRLGLVPRGLKTFFPFTTAKVLIFSSHNERDAIAGWAPWIWRRSVVIPIGSTIPAGNGIKTDSVLVHFGQIAPGKGLEDFLELARNGADSTVKYVLIGGLPAGEREYQAAILSGLERNSVDLVLNQPPHVVADMLSAARYAYLPFPDGASAKRTTLLTALINKLVVLTTHGPETPDWVRSVTVRANSPEEAGEALLRFEREILKREALMKKIEATLERFSWPFIAEQHVDIYRRVLSSRNGLRLSPR